MSDLFVLFIPTFGFHALALCFSGFLKNSGQLFDYGDICIELQFQIDNENIPPKVGLRKLLKANISDSPEISVGDLLRNQIWFVPLLRFTAVSPAVLYAIAIAILFAQTAGVDLSSWDHGFIQISCLFLAVLFQISHVAIKIFSGFFEHLIELHPKYMEDSIFSVLIDLTLAKKR
ncbi:MAG: hypothetical protein P1U65_17135 [Minwuia sp.]|nr:hypothetical protein [Minwuia sp.]